MKLAWLAVALVSPFDPDLEGELRRLESESLEERCVAAAALVQRGAEAVPALLGAHRAARDPEVRFRLAGILEKIGEPAFLELRRNPVPGLEDVVHALGVRRERPLVGAILAELGRPFPELAASLDGAAIRDPRSVTLEWAESGGKGREAELTLFSLRPSGWTRTIVTAGGALRFEKAAISEEAATTVRYRLLAAVPIRIDEVPVPHRFRSRGHSFRSWVRMSGSGEGFYEETYWGYVSREARCVRRFLPLMVMERLLKATLPDPAWEPCGLEEAHRATAAAWMESMLHQELFGDGGGEAEELFRSLWRAGGEWPESRVALDHVRSCDGCRWLRLPAARRWWALRDSNP